MCCVGAVGGDDHVQQRPGEFIALQEILSLGEYYTVIEEILKVHVDFVNIKTSRGRDGKSAY